MLAKQEAALPQGLATQLTKAYNYKQQADYDINAVGPITLERAAEAIITAESFVADIRMALASSATGAA